MTSWRYDLTDYFGQGHRARRGLVVRSMGGGSVGLVGGISGSGGGSVYQPSGQQTGQLAPAINATVNTDDPYRAGTLVITRTSDQHVYVSGTDYAEVLPNQWTNLTIPLNTGITITYIIDTGVAYSGLTAEQADALFTTPAEVATLLAAAIAAHSILADPHTVYQKESERNQANGYAGLSAQTRLSLTQMGSGTPGDGKYVDGGSGAWTTLPSGGGGGGSGGHIIQDEGTAETQRPTLNFVGAGVSVADDSANNRTNVQIAGGGSGGAASYASLVKFGAA